MKTTKIFFPVLLGIWALAMCSCNSAEYRPTDDNCAFVIKKIDGKRQWGLVENWDKEREFIPCQYDSIFSAYGPPYNITHLFIGIKDGKMYAWDDCGKQLLNGKGFTSLVPNKQHPPHNKSILAGGALFHEVQTNDGIMFFYLSSQGWVEFGPAEAVLWGETAILHKKNGKWGIWDMENHQEITPCIYSSVISVREDYFWVKKDEKWVAVNRENRVMRKSQSLLNKYLNMSSMDREQYRREEKSALFRKISIEEASYISVDPYNADYISW